MSGKRYRTYEKPVRVQHAELPQKKRRRRNVRYEEDGLIEKRDIEKDAPAEKLNLQTEKAEGKGGDIQLRENQAKENVGDISDIPSDCYKGNGLPTKKQRQRQQADTFRRMEARSACGADNLKKTAPKENDPREAVTAGHKKTRLIHGNDSDGMIWGAGRMAAASVKRYFRREQEEADPENTAVQAVQAGTETGKLMQHSLRHRQVKNISGHTGSAHSKRENAAQTEKRKKDEIKTHFRKKRYRAAIEERRLYNADLSIGFAAPLKRFFAVTGKIGETVQTFFSEHRGAVITLAAGGILFGMIAVSLIGSLALVQSSGATIVGTTYNGKDEDIYAAEELLEELEDRLNAEMNSFAKTHPGYHEYNYQIDEIEHNPYNLISYLQAKYGSFTMTDEIKAEIRRLFDSQYILTLSEQTEKRKRIDKVIKTREIYDPDIDKWFTEEYEVEVEVEYDHKTINCVLTNKYFDLIARNNLTRDQLILYNALNQTYGNRDYLFDTRLTGPAVTPGSRYEIPPEALSDEKFAAIIREAEKYLGYPYVLGGKDPHSSFDCSGFVCWVLNHCDNHWNVGNKLAKELCTFCIYVTPTEARPGDLIFFEKTYDTDGASHVGIYVGDGMMLHCGNPIKYSSINTRYFQEHFLCFGRLPFYDDK